jgi:hypothetical protein
MPQPFRLINSIFENEILKPVYRKIFDIEDMKNNPSYEGNIKRCVPSGVFEMQRVTTICGDKLSNGQILVGDSDGKISLMDLGKKNLTSRIGIEG